MRLGKRAGYRNDHFLVDKTHTMKYSCQGQRIKTPHHNISPLQGEPVLDIFSTRGSPRRISWAVCAAEQDDALEAGAAAAALEVEARVEHGRRR